MVASDLAEFLDRFTRIYAVTTELVRQEHPAMVTPELSPRNQEYFLNAIQPKLMGLEAVGATARSEAQQLRIVRIRKSSPLEMWFGGVTTALAMAVIISGGEVDLVRKIQDSCARRWFGEAEKSV